MVMVRGVLHTSQLGVPYIQFLGIPYAAPPVGSMRFKPPQKPPSWGENVLEANKEMLPCPAKNVFTQTFVGSDDCLYLNVFTKTLNPKKPQAVMIFIHGGGHFSGSSSLDIYSPDYMLLSDVVVVTFNYRLGPLGFLSLKDKSLNVPGNAGLKDQQLAMKFVKDNIRNFGGDPNNCTLFGHSSGATCVSLHCMAESSCGLFDRAIIMSGSPLAQEAQFPDENYPLKLANKLGFDGESEVELLAFLNNADVLSMAEVQHSLIDSKGSKFAPMPFGPCIEPYESDTTFMRKTPRDLLSSAWSNSIDVIIGATSDEGLHCRPEFEKNSNFKAIIPNELKLAVDEQKLEDFAVRLKEFYLTLFPSEFEAYQKFNGDQFRWIALQRFIHARRSCNGSGRTFLYRFAVDSPTQNHYRNRWIGPGIKGVVHADDLCYLWKSNQGGVPSRDTIEFISILRFTTLLTSFAITGDPNSNVLDVDLGSVIWKPVTVAPYEGLNIDRTLEFSVLEESKRLKLLESLYEEASVRLH
ncbi:hypothetical protein HA402_005606 [Bradysia odoriphaga]|nr:hypothetical protein HA402_005606 [Bradysia odoriphaga]